MELLKTGKPLEYKYLDVTFLIKPYATAMDKLQILATGDITDAKVTMKRLDFMCSLIEIFVVGWRGVTEDGKMVPYSFVTFKERFPVNANPKEDVFLGLTQFILDNTGVLAVDIISKNGSREQLSGPAK